MPLRAYSADSIWTDLTLPSPQLPSNRTLGGTNDTNGETCWDQRGSVQKKAIQQNLTQRGNPSHVLWVHKPCGPQHSEFFSKSPLLQFGSGCVKKERVYSILCVCPEHQWHHDHHDNMTTRTTECFVPAELLSTTWCYPKIFQRVLLMFSGEHTDIHVLWWERDWGGDQSDFHRDYYRL